jgi:hypothetical protein
MSKIKIIHQGIRGPTAQCYHYAVDVDGTYWISELPWKSGGLDFKAPIVWRKPTKEDEIRVGFSPEELKSKDFDAMFFLRHRTHNSASEYVTRHTGGSIRHAGIRVMDVMEMIHDYSKDAERALEDAYALGKIHGRKETKKKVPAKKVSKLPRAHRS